jgi:hypothetical protein
VTIEIRKLAALEKGKDLFQPDLLFPGGIILREPEHEGRTAFASEDQAKARGEILRNALALDANTGGK